MTKEQIQEEAESQFPVDIKNHTRDSPHNIIQRYKQDAYVTAATKYAALLIDLQERYNHLTGVYEKQNKEIARLTTEAEQSLLLYNNMVATIVKRDEEIERLKAALAEVEKKVGLINPKDIVGTGRIVIAVMVDIKKGLNTYKQQ